MKNEIENILNLIINLDQKKETIKNKSELKKIELEILLLEKLIKDISSYEKPLSKKEVVL